MLIIVQSVLCHHQSTIQPNCLTAWEQGGYWKYEKYLADMKQKPFHFMFSKLINMHSRIIFVVFQKYVLNQLTDRGLVMPYGNT